MNIPRRRFIVLALCAGLLVGLATFTGALSVGANPPDSLRDAPDWPTAIATGPDGSVWLGVALDVADIGGFARYDADLVFEQAWVASSWPRAIAVGPGGDVFVDQHDNSPIPPNYYIGRFTGSGDFLLSLDPQMITLALDTAPSGNVFALGNQDGSGEGNQVKALEPMGRQTEAWTAADFSISLTVGPDGDVYVGQSMALFGSVWRYKPDGTAVSQQTMTSIPVGMDFGPDGLLYVAGQYGPPRGHVTIHEADGTFVREWTVDARPEDLAVGLDGSVYVIVWIAADRRYEVRKYDPLGNLLVRLVDIPGIRSTPQPHTATPRQSPIATGTSVPPSATATPTATVTATPHPPADLFFPLALANAMPHQDSARPTEPAPVTQPPPASPTHAPVPATEAPSATPTLVATPGGTTPVTPTTTPVPVTVIDRGIDPDEHTVDPYTIVGARVDGDIFHLRAQYSGGCRKHQFGLVASSLFMESNPVQADLLLTHNANGDPCQALITEDLRFDLAPLKEAYERSYPGAGGPILLRVRSWPDLVRYGFRRR